MNILSRRFGMKKIICVWAIAASLLVGAVAVQAEDVAFNINLNFGNASPQPVLEEPPVFIFPAALGIYVAVGIPHDMFLVGYDYYMFRNGNWLVARSYNGPWAVIPYGRLPRGLRNHPYAEMIRFRDEEYRVYSRDRANYRGKHYKPAKHEVRQEKKKDNREGKGKGRK
jgi:hypothetical protein